MNEGKSGGGVAVLDVVTDPPFYRRHANLLICVLVFIVAGLAIFWLWDLFKLLA